MRAVCTGALGRPMRYWMMTPGADDCDRQDATTAAKYKQGRSKCASLSPNYSDPVKKMFEEMMYIINIPMYLS